MSPSAWIAPTDWIHEPSRASALPGIRPSIRAMRAQRPDADSTTPSPPRNARYAWTRLLSSSSAIDRERSCEMTPTSPDTRFEASTRSRGGNALADGCLRAARVRAENDPRPRRSFAGGVRARTAAEVLRREPIDLLERPLRRSARRIDGGVRRADPVI